MMPQLLRSFAMTVLVVTLALNLAACGNKGKLRTPAQAQMDEAKKAKKKAKADKNAADEKAPVQETPAAPPTVPQPPLAGEETGQSPVNAASGVK